jgi:hypothetical protein
MENLRVMRNSELVDAACTRWLAKRGHMYTMRDTINASCRGGTSAKSRKKVRKEQRLDDIADEIRTE